MKILPILMLLTIFSFNAAYAETVYEATDKEGDVILSDQPISGAKNQQTITIQQPSSTDQSQADKSHDQLMQQDQILSNQLEQQDQQYASLVQNLREAQAELATAKKQWEAASNAYYSTTPDTVEAVDESGDASQLGGATQPAQLEQEMYNAQSQVAAAQANVDTAQQALDDYKAQLQ